MISILVLVVLAIAIFKLAKERIRNPYLHVLILVILWLGLEFLGAFIAGLLFEGDAFIASAGGWMGAIIGGTAAYLITDNQKPAKKAASDDILDSGE